MPVGTQFSSLLTALRAETRRSSDVSVGVDDNDSLKRTINGIYRTLALEHDWPHLRHIFDKLPLASGQRFYDYQTGFNPDRVWQMVVWIGGMNQPIRKGIDPGEYSFLDPAADQRSDPPLAWDTNFDPTSGKSQIEIWPIPASSDYSIQAIGQWEPTPLVNDSDPCLLDDELIIKFSAARQLAAGGQKDADTVLKEAQGYLLKLQTRPKADAKQVQMGLGAGHLSDRDRYAHPAVVIKPTSGSS